MMHHQIHIATEDSDLEKQLTSGLTALGFQVAAFRSGYPVVEMMDQYPDLFIIDIELPDINGIEVCRWIKSHQSSCHVPVILVSKEPYLKVLAASAQPDGYIETPFSFSEAAEKIKALILTEHVEG